MKITERALGVGMPDERDLLSNDILNRMKGGILHPDGFPPWLGGSLPSAGPPPGLDWGGQDHPAPEPLSLDGRMPGQSSSDAWQGLFAAPQFSLQSEFQSPSGYAPVAGDDNRLARILFAEGASTPEDYPALGWTIMNRVGQFGHGETLDDVIHKPGQFASVKEGNSAHVDSDQWTRSASPERMDSASSEAWTRAQQVARGILSGSISDPTGGATLFFNSDHFDGSPNSAPGKSFPKMLSGRTIIASPYKTQTSSRNRNYFWIE